MQYYNETMVNKLSYEMGRHLMLDFTLSYMTNTWVPPMEHVRPEKVMFHPKLTGLFDPWEWVPEFQLNWRKSIFLVFLGQIYEIFDNSF